MMAFGAEQTEALEGALDTLIAGNIEHPARELMWGSPGTMLAALFLYERTGKQRWSDLFRLTAGKLWSQLEWSPRHLCSCWTQDWWPAPDLSRRRAWIRRHGLAADPGRHLLDTEEWNGRALHCQYGQRTAERLGTHTGALNSTTRHPKRLLQFCTAHPVSSSTRAAGQALDDLLLLPERPSGWPGR
jgi:hypothetical protein